MKPTALKIIFGLFLFFSNINAGYTAEKMSLGMPIDCVPGKSCSIQKYVDMDPSPIAQDFNCGTLSTDTHKGTDIRLPSYREMEAGVNVLAAAEGKVVDVRNGMPDVSSKLLTYEVVTNRGYGNRVAIQHADGYMTVYAHLKRDSLKVELGSIVKKGQIIGQVGMSGLSEYPHLHFELRQNNKITDPFTGMQEGTGCANFSRSYWDETADGLMLYNPTFLISAGFSSVELNRDAAEYQVYEDEISSTTKLLMFNLYLAGLQQGDIFKIRIIGPDGTSILFDASDSLEKGYVVRHLAGGKNNMQKALPKGVYTGEFLLTRNGKNLIEASKKVKIN